MNDERSIEDRATDLGWVSQDHFRGDPDRWIDAETFVKRGEELMPLLRANNKKLTEELGSLKSQLAETQNLLKASAESIEALKDFNSKALREQAKEKRGEIVEAIKAARENGDVESEVALTEQLQEQTAAIKASEQRPVETTKSPAVDPNDPTKSPEWIAWTADNDWFGKDKRRTALALGIADELRSNGEKADGRAFLDKVAAEVDKVLGGGSNRNTPSKVEGGARSSSNGSGNGSSGRSFADLPPEARAACDKQAARLVGEGRAFKNQEEWRRHYAKKYFEEA